MWLLLMITLTVVRGVTVPEDTQRVTLLNTFATYQDCEPERNRIGFAMWEAYLGEIDFVILCEFRKDNLKVQARLPSDGDDRIMKGSGTATLAVGRRDGFPFNGAAARERAVLPQRLLPIVPALAFVD